MKNTTPLSFGEKIKQIRIAKGLKQEDVAKAINVAQNSVSRLESGEAKYDDLLLAAIREFYGIENAPLFDHEIENYRNRLWVWNDYIDANRIDDAKEMQDEMSAILTLPFEHDLILLYYMIETRILFKEGNRGAGEEMPSYLKMGEEMLNKAKSLLDCASDEALHLYHRNMGFLFLIQRAYKKSLHHLIQSLDYETDNVKPKDAGILHNIGILYYRLGKPWQAIGFFEQANIKYSTGRTNVFESHVNLAIATCSMWVGEFDKAEKLYKSAVKQAKHINDDRAAGMAMANLSFVYRKKGDINECIETCDQALMLLKNTSHSIYALVNKALCLIKLKDIAQCKELIKQGMELVKADKNLTILVETVNHIATIDNSESANYLENFAIPHFKIANPEDGGGIYMSLDLCNILEAHYRKKRNMKKTNEIAALGRDIAIEMFYGEVEFE